MDTLERLERTIAERRKASPDESYVASLTARGLPVIARKLGEEATEAVVAAHALNHMLAAASRQHQRGKPARSAHQDWLQPPRKVRILSHQSFRPRQVEFRHRF